MLTDWLPDEPVAYALAALIVFTCVWSIWTDWRERRRQKRVKRIWHQL